MYNKQAEIDLLASEIAWLEQIPEESVKSKPVKTRSIAEAMMFFARDLKREHVNYSVKLDKVAVAGEASNSIVDLTSRLVVIDNQRYIPIDTSGSYLRLDGFKSFIDDFIVEGVLVRKLKIGESGGFELSILVPVSV